MFREFSLHGPVLFFICGFLVAETENPGRRFLLGRALKPTIWNLFDIDDSSSVKGRHNLSMRRPVHRMNEAQRHLAANLRIEVVMSESSKRSAFGWSAQLGVNGYQRKSSRGGVNTWTSSACSMISMLCSMFAGMA
jgi:hypothetical protein